MSILTRIAISAAIVTACTNAAFAAKVVPAGSSIRARAIVARVAVSQSEFAQESVFKDNDDVLLVAAQLKFDDFEDRSATARDKATRLEAKASELRRVAYTLTDQPDLSAVQNQKMLVAMEAADAAESEAGVAQTNDRLATTAVNAGRQTIVVLTGQIASLQQSMDACTAFIRSSGFTVRQVPQVAPGLDSTATPTSR